MDTRFFVRFFQFFLNKTPDLFRRSSRKFRQLHQARLKRIAVQEFKFLHSTAHPKRIIKWDRIGFEPVPHDLRVLNVWTIRMASACTKGQYSPARPARREHPARYDSAQDFARIRSASSVRAPPPSQRSNRTRTDAGSSSQQLVLLLF